MFQHHQTGKPFAFNLLKHHKVFVEDLKHNFHPENLNELLEILDKGSNLLCDYYFGSLSPEDIVEEIEFQLKQKDRYEANNFSCWINQSRGKYRNLTLTDDSEWPLLLGDNSENYIHIHPARHSKHTLRVRFLALKTALVFILLYPNQNLQDIETINQIRVNYLKSSPIKLSGDISHILKIVSLFLNI